MAANLLAPDAARAQLRVKKTVKRPACREVEMFLRKKRGRPALAAERSCVGDLLSPSVALDAMLEDPSFYVPGFTKRSLSVTERTNFRSLCQSMVDIIHCAHPGCRRGYTSVQGVGQHLKVNACSPSVRFLKLHTPFLTAMTAQGCRRAPRAVSRPQQIHRDSRCIFRDEGCGWKSSPAC